MNDLINIPINRRQRYENLQEENRLDNNSYLHSQRNLSKSIIDMLETIKDSRILEIGCGGGHLSNFMQKNGNLVISIDISNSALLTAKNNYNNLNLIQMDAEKIGFANNYFDTVISIELIEHIPNLQIHFEEIRKILKDDGIYLFKTPNKWMHDFYWRFLRRKDVSEQHPSVCSIKSLKWLLSRNDFSFQFYKQDRLTEGQILKIKRILPSQSLPKITSNLINILIFCVNISLMPSIICLAKKK